MSKLTLISHTLCPFVQRAAISLAEKSIEFERKDIDLGNKPDWFLKISPLGKVPLLIVSEDGKDDVVIFESNVILEYLEDTTEPKLHPTDALERARHRSWNEFGSALLGEMWGYYNQKDQDKFNQIGQELAAKLSMVEAELAKNKSGDFFAGETFSTVDAVYAPLFRYFDLIESETDISIIADLENVGKWRKALRERSSVQAVVASNFSQLLKQFMVKFNGVMGQKLAA
ncbi:MAG: glutathione S-transferase [Hyphomicrobiales bacterium]|nr:MAG: glutathione S-transferase [Hyphomicrobiales bacterium]